MTELVAQFFIAAARHAAEWPKPFRFEAREALRSLPARWFGMECSHERCDYEVGGRWSCEWEVA